MYPGLLKQRNKSYKRAACLKLSANGKYKQPAWLSEKYFQTKVADEEDRPPNFKVFDWITKVFFIKETQNSNLNQKLKEEYS